MNLMAQKRKEKEPSSAMVQRCFTRCWNIITLSLQVLLGGARNGHCMFDAEPATKLQPMGMFDEKKNQQNAQQKLYIKIQRMYKLCINFLTFKMEL